jgi:hypothetical protein
MRPEKRKPLSAIISAMRTALCAFSRAAASVLFVLFLPSPLVAQDSLDLRMEASITADDNVTRSRGADKLGDTIYAVNVGKTWWFPATERTRWKVVGTGGVEAFQRYSGLSRAFVGVEGEWQYRPTGQFSAPTFGLFARAFVDSYQSDLRDGFRASVGARVLQPITDKLEIFGALTHNVGDATSDVFDNKEVSARLNLDYAVSPAGTLYAGGEYRRGQIVSVASSNPAPGKVEVQAADDVFRDPDRTAYRVKAKTGIVTLGYSHQLDTDQALDLSLRAVRSSLTYASGVRYYATQATLAYLIRF